MPKFQFDTQSLAEQIDVLRDYLRQLWMRDGPVPAGLALDHDMLWPERNAEALENEAVKLAQQADTARVQANQLKEASSPQAGDAENKARAAELAARNARKNADTAGQELEKLRDGSSRAGVFGLTGRSLTADGRPLTTAEQSARDVGRGPVDARRNVREDNLENKTNVTGVSGLQDVAAQDQAAKDADAAIAADKARATELARRRAAEDQTIKDQAAKDSDAAAKRSVKERLGHS